VRRGSQDTEPTGVRDRGDDVAAVTEGEQRELDAEYLASRILHSFS
jgi:hypothetical protein